MYVLLRQADMLALRRSIDCACVYVTYFILTVYLVVPEDWGLSELKSMLITSAPYHHSLAMGAMGAIVPRPKSCEQSRAL